MRSRNHEPKGAGGWLLGYLRQQGGSAPYSDIVVAGDVAGFSEEAIKKAAARSDGKIKKERVGFPSMSIWMLA